jgi:hypothetical protein
MNKNQIVGRAIALGAAIFYGSIGYTKARDRLVQYAG